jgi:hypothetical protein
MNTKTKTFWHDWVPVWLPISFSILGAAGALVWAGATFYTSVNDNLKSINDRITAVENQHSMMEEKLSVIGRNESRIMERLGIPPENTPTMYGWPAGTIPTTLPQRFPLETEPPASLRSKGHSLMEPKAKFGQ